MPCSARNQELCQLRLGSVVSAPSLYPDGTKLGIAGGSCTEMSAVSHHTPLLHPNPSSPAPLAWDTQGQVWPHSAAGRTLTHGGCATATGDVFAADLGISD